MDHPGNTRKFSDAQRTIQALRDKGVQFWIENDTLRYRAPRGSVTLDDMTNLCRSEAGVLSLLIERRETRRFEPYLVRRAAPRSAPLGYSQLGHWNSRAMAGHRPIRQVASATRLQGRMDVGALKEAFSVVVSRHDAFRTRVVIDNRGDPAQEIVPWREPNLKLVDLSGISSSDRAAEFQRHIDSAIIEVKDYVADPLAATLLLNLGRDDNVLALAMDHIVSDGASLSIVFGELMTAYTQLIHGDSILLSPVRMKLADYAAWQRTELPAWLEGRSSEWDSWGLTRFPEDTSNSGAVGWGLERLVIDSRAKSDLSKWARSRGTSLAMTVLGAYVALLSRWCESSEVVVQFISDGRMSRLLENTVGDLTFPIYLRIGAGKDETLVGLLESITKEYCRASEKPEFGYAFTQNPLPDLVRNPSFNWIPHREHYANPSASRLRSGLSCSNVSFENPALGAFEWDGGPSVTFWENSDEVISEVSFSRKRFSCSLMGRFMVNLRVFLDVLLTKPTMPIRDVALI